MQPLLESCEGLRGSALVDHLVACLDAGDGSHARRQLAPLFDVPESAGPEQMLDLLEDLQFFRGFSDDDGVRVCSPETASGSAFAHVFVVGFANGLFPERRYFDLTELSIERQERMARRDRRRVRDLRQTAIHELHVGSFARMEQEAARRCGVKQDRIFVAEDGTQYAKVSPSIYTNALCGKP